MLGSKTLRHEIVSRLSNDNVMRDCRWIAEETPWRLSGSPASEKAAQYVVDALRKNGVKADLLSMHGWLDFPQPAQLRLLSPSEKEIPCAAFAQIGSTPREGLKAEVVYVGSGGEENYQDKDVRGKIVLCELSYSPPRPEKVRIAMSHGAAGVLMMNWGSDANPLLPLGTVKPVWGNPTPETVHLMENTPPVLGIARRDGVYLRNLLLAKEKVEVWMKAQAERKWLKVYIPYGEVEAPNGDGDFLLVAGHMDSWAQGASDNASGNACKIEIARVLQQNRHLLKRNVRFAFWQCHETGIMEGSTWFVEKFWDDLDDHCVAYFNYDSPGMEGTTVWRADTSSELLYWHQAIEEDIIPGVPRNRRKVERTGDQSFFGVGVPAMCCWMVHTPEEIAKWNGAILGEWYHSEADTMEHIDPRILETCLRVYGAYTFEMAATRVLPMNFTPVAEDFVNRLQEIKQMSQGRPDALDVLELEPVMQYAQVFKEKAQALEKARQSLAHDEQKNVQTMNKALKHLSRVLNPVKCTVSGRYEQDTYGLSALQYNIPGLQSAAKMIAGEAGSHQFFLWSTRVRRERNRVSDALRRAIDICDSFIG